MTLVYLAAGLLLVLPPGAPLAVDNRLEAPADRQDVRVFHSPPSALHLSADVPGEQYFRFPEIPIRPATRYRLRFHFLIARGGDAEARYAVRVAQYRDTPKAWKALGSREIPLTVVGGWVAVDEIVTTDRDATMVGIDARISSDADVGECWIDNLSLSVVGQPVTAGP